MSFGRKIKRAGEMARRRERKRIQKDLAKKARARDAEKQSVSDFHLRATAPVNVKQSPLHLGASIVDGEIVIDARENVETAATL